MWIESGDGPEGQPGEGVMSLSDLAAQMEGSENEGEEAPEGEPEEDGEAPEQDEAPEADDEQPDAKPEPEFTIKVDGKDVKLKQSELIEFAQKGTDYTNKTMALAEERKAVDAVRKQVDEHRQRQEQALGETLHSLQVATRFMESQIGEAPDVALLDTDPRAFLLQKEQYEARKGQLHQALQVAQQVQQEQARQRHAWMQERAAKTEQALRDTLPGWNDASIDELAGYAGTLGLSPQNAEAAMLEPGFWQAIHKAKAYDALMAKKAELKPTAAMPKVTPPKASNPTPRAEVKKTEAFKNFRAKPSLDSLSKLVD